MAHGKAEMRFLMTQSLEKEGRKEVGGGTNLASKGFCDALVVLAQWLEHQPGD